MAGPAYELQAELNKLGTAWLNAPPDDADPPPYIVAYLITRERLTNETQEYHYRIDCYAPTIAEAMALAESVRLHDEWPWPLIYLSEKDEYVSPDDGGDLLHVVSVNVQLHAE